MKTAAQSGPKGSSVKWTAVHYRTLNLLSQMLKSHPSRDDAGMKISLNPEGQLFLSQFTVLSGSKRGLISCDVALSAPSTT